jgi:nucleotide-binding universal stress UspA family protein
MNVHETGSTGVLGVRNQFLQTVLVGVDGSRGSSAAIEWSARLAGMSGAKVLAAHVLTYNREFVRDLTLDTIRTWRLELVHDLETRWTDHLRSVGVPHRCVLVEDDSPARGLLHLAEREQAGLLVVGSRGRGALGGHLLGGTSYKLVHHADRPVVVVPADEPRPAPC